MDSQSIAKTILQQLGGRKFITMTGSSNFGGGIDEKSNPYLIMRLKRNKSDARYLSITLNAMDTYDMKFMKLDHNDSIKIVSEHNDIYCDMLQDVFTEVTGLYTHL